MAWIRRVRTKSGATAVQIAESVAGRRRIVRHVGSAADEVTLALLMQRARDLLKDDLQGELDLGLQVPQSRARLVRGPRELVLFDDSGDMSVGLVAPARVLRTSSRLIFEVFARVYAELGFDILGDECFRDLVIARLVEPTSLLDVDRVLAQLGRSAASLSTRKRTLQRCANRHYRDLLAAACYTESVTSGDLSLCLYDVTTLYFEAEKEDDLRKVGFSKERRVDPQIVVGLLVDRGGFPLEVGAFMGNKAETLTLQPVVQQFQQRHQISGIVVVADAGMLSAENLKSLDDAGIFFIVGSRSSKAPHDLASHFHWHGDAFADGQIIDTITPRDGRSGSENTRLERREPVWSPGVHHRSWRAVWAYSHKRFIRDNKTINLQEAKARAVVNGERVAKKPRFVKIRGDAKTLDVTGIAKARRVAGLKGYVTNIPANQMDAAEVISSYHDLWHVEQSFRMSKTDLRARPFFARTSDAINAHLTIVFAALAIARTIQTRTGWSLRRIRRQLIPLRTATILINGQTIEINPQIDTESQALLDAINPPGTTVENLAR